MIIGIGIDITEINRIKNATMKHESFIDKVLTDKEKEELNNKSGNSKYTYIAGRFSAKESFAKAMGTGIGKKVGLHDLSILNDSMGKPFVDTSLTNNSIHISISHTDTLVMTEIIIEEE